MIRLWHNIIEFCVLQPTILTKTCLKSKLTFFTLLYQSIFQWQCYNVQKIQFCSYFTHDNMKNKIEGTPILKLAMVKRLQVKKLVKTIGQKIGQKIDSSQNSSKIYHKILHKIYHKIRHTKLRQGHQNNKFYIIL